MTITLHRADGRRPFVAGSTIAATLTPATIARLVTDDAQGIDIPSTSGPIPTGRRMIAVVIVTTATLTEGEMADQDAWDRKHTATVRLATSAEGAALIQQQQAQQAAQAQEQERRTRARKLELKQQNALARR